MGRTAAANARIPIHTSSHASLPEGIPRIAQGKVRGIGRNPGKIHAVKLRPIEPVDTSIRCFSYNGSRQTDPTGRGRAAQCSHGFATLHRGLFSALPSGESFVIKSSFGKCATNKPKPAIEEMLESKCFNGVSGWNPSPCGRYLIIPRWLFSMKAARMAASSPSMALIFSRACEVFSLLPADGGRPSAGSAAAREKSRAEPARPC